MLVAGGRHFITPRRTIDLRSAEIFDPASGTWSPAPPMLHARESHAAVTLDDGRVLVVGGSAYDSGSGAVGTAEVFDPASGRWTELDRPGLRADVSATVLEDGRVLVIGFPRDVSTHDQVVRLFDPRTDSWTTPAPSSLLHAGHHAVRLSDGRVLVVGGVELIGEGVPPAVDNAAIYDPKRDSWTNVGPMPREHVGEPVEVLPDGRVLAVNGFRSQIYDPDTDTWTLAAGTGSEEVTSVGTSLADGRVLVFSEGPDGSTPVAEAYDAATDRWSVFSSFLFVVDHTATRLEDGRVVVAGGYFDCHYGQPCVKPPNLTDTYVYDPGA